MSKPIDFYFDFSSPYGYIASQRIDAIAVKHGRSVNWRPYLLGAVFKVNSRKPLPDQPLIGDYARHDFERSARLYGVPFKYPTRMPISGVSPARTYYWVHDRDQQKAKELVLALYKAYFVEDRDISDPEQVADVAATLGLDRDATLAAMQEPPVKERLKKETDAAIARGAFGSPFVFVDDEPFWGNDRLDQVDRWLATGGW